MHVTGNTITLSIPINPHHFQLCYANGTALSTALWTLNIICKWLIGNSEYLKRILFASTSAGWAVYRDTMEGHEGLKGLDTLQSVAKELGMTYTI